MTPGTIPEGKDVPSLREFSIARADGLVGTVPADYAELLHITNFGIPGAIHVSGTMLTAVPKTLKLLDLAMTAVSGECPTFPVGSELNYFAMRDDAISKHVLSVLAIC